MDLPETPSSLRSEIQGQVPSYRARLWLTEDGRFWACVGDWSTLAHRSAQPMAELNPFESAVLKALLDGEDPVLEVLRAQLERVRVKGRDLTGVGFFTNFELSHEVEPVPGRPSLQLGDIEVAFEPLKHGAGVVLFVRDGLLDFLEGFTYDEPWPTDPWPKTFTLTRTVITWRHRMARGVRRVRWYLKKMVAIAGAVVGLVVIGVPLGLAMLGDVPSWARDRNCDGKVTVGEWFDLGIDHGWSPSNASSSCHEVFAYKDGLPVVTWCGEPPTCSLARR